jgi:hypothetical protein
MSYNKPKVYKTGPGLIHGERRLARSWLGLGQQVHVFRLLL